MIRRGERLSHDDYSPYLRNTLWLRFISSRFCAKPISSSTSHIGCTASPWLSTARCFPAASWPSTRYQERHYTIMTGSLQRPQDAEIALDSKTRTCAAILHCKTECTSESCVGERASDFFFHDRGRASIPLPGEVADDAGPPQVERPARRQCDHRKRPTRVPVYEQSEVRPIFRQRKQIARRQLFAEFPAESLGVLGTDLKADQGPDIAEDGIRRGLIHLRDVLIRKSQTESVLPGLGENGGKALGHKRLKLVDVCRAGLSRPHFRVGSAHGSELQGCHEERSKQRRSILAQATLRQVHKQDAAVVYCLAEVEARSWLSQDVP